MCKFVNVKNLNEIDPVVNLKFEKNTFKNIDKAIKTSKPNFIFVNTSKLLYIYKDLLLNSNKQFKTILVAHDLYHFRKKYFKKISIIDKTPLSNNNEIKVIKKSNYVIDISYEEKKYLLSQRISNKKIIFTKTPVELKKKSKFTKKFDFVYLGSNWRQNILSLNYLYKKLIIKFPNMKFLVLGMNKISGYKNNVIFKTFKKNFLHNCNYGLAFIEYGSGRNVKIFEMMSFGIPVVTNKKLSTYGLKENIHYIFASNIGGCISKISKISHDKNLRKKISKNCLLWISKNSYYLKAFKKLEKII